MSSASKKNNYLLYGGISGAAVVVLVILFAVPQIRYAKQYEQSIFPGVNVGDVDFSGMSRVQAEDAIKQFHRELREGGLPFVFEDPGGLQHERVVYPWYLDEEENRVPFLDVDSKASVDALFKVGRTGGFPAEWLSRMHARSYGRDVALVIDADSDRFEQAVAVHIAGTQKEAIDAVVVRVETGFDVRKEQEGVSYPVEDQINKALDGLRVMKKEVVTIAGVINEPKVTSKEIVSVLPHLPAVVAKGGMEIVYDEKVWELPAGTLASVLGVVKDEEGALVMSVDKVAIGGWLDQNVSPAVEQETRDAKLVLSEDGTYAEEFVSSVDGLTINIALTSGSVSEALQRRFESVSVSALEGDLSEEFIKERIGLTVSKTEPETRTEDTNKLGINELLGSGVSDFSGSPHNRVKNIGVAVEKLNGYIIKPGEEFSMLGALRPFTFDNGYFKELVIKGDEIKPEIAGGLCQIGTTSFRMAMNSGMPVTQRRNHSLVVSYYDDPSNGNPGTDATIYDPAPDFKFLNDTGGHILWITSMNTKTGELKFSLWGTSDGREGSYTPPTVTRRWKSEEETIERETTDLQPGERKCQHAYPGAEAEFTYTRILPDGTKDQTVYTSIYRALPEICLTGVDPEEKEQDELAEELFPDEPVAIE